MAEPRERATRGGERSKAKARSCPSHRSGCDAAPQKRLKRARVRRSKSGGGTIKLHQPRQATSDTNGKPRPAHRRTGSTNSAVWSSSGSDYGSDDETLDRQGKQKTKASASTHQCRHPSPPLLLLPVAPQALAPTPAPQAAQTAMIHKPLPAEVAVGMLIDLNFKPGPRPTYFGESCHHSRYHGSTSHECALVALLLACLLRSPA